MSDEQTEPDVDEDAERNTELDRECARFAGAFVESADLMHVPPVRMTVVDVHAPNTVKAADGRLIDKPVLSLKGTSKQFILGRTNERILKAMHGSKASGWKGQTVTLGVRYLAQAFGERNVPTVRIIPPADVPLPFSARKHYGAAEPYTT